MAENQPLSQAAPLPLSSSTIDPNPIVDEPSPARLPTAVGSSSAATSFTPLIPLAGISATPNAAAVPSRIAPPALTTNATPTALPKSGPPGQALTISLHSLSSAPQQPGIQQNALTTTHAEAESPARSGPAVSAAPLAAKVPPTVQAPPQTAIIPVPAQPQSSGVAGPSRPSIPPASPISAIPASQSSSSRKQPPYIAPSDVVYPPDGIPNPNVRSMDPQPIFENLPALSLFRPSVLPPDLDERIASNSVWLGVERETAKAIYFVPPSCRSCTHPSVNTHCNRDWPKCGRCTSKNLDCVYGNSWRMLKSRSRRTPHNAATATAAAASASTSNGHDPVTKGKARANDSVLAEPQSRANGDVVGQAQAKDEGKAKRVRKKRRLSASNELDPNELDDASIPPPKRPYRRQSKPTLPNGRASGDPPLTADDRAYFSRIEANALRPPLVKMKGPCPVWADSRRALLSAVEYYRQPMKSVGASVEVGPGGIARAVLLEGQAPGQGSFWGTGREAGTIITSIGHARPKAPPSKSANTPWLKSPPQPENSEAFVRASSPPVNLLPSVINTESSNTSNSRPQETVEIDALLVAHRARTPVAVMVAEDYSAAPFKIPRRFVVLGWFWVTDAWVEPILPGLIMFTENQTPPDRAPELVAWKFRFEWCQPQTTPWWSSETESDRPVHADISQSYISTSWEVSGPNVEGSLTVRPAPKDGPEKAAEPALLNSKQELEPKWWYTCQICKASSHRVYDMGDICLNEVCPWFFGDASREDNHVGPSSNVPHALEPMQRISPSQLGLQLRPPEPSAKRVEVLRSQAGREFWRGWVCHKCGMAGERKKWKEWDCEACSHLICIPRKMYDVGYLRPPSRPVATGPRQEDGFPSFPFPTSRSWTLYKDDIKVVSHAVDSVEGLGVGTNLYHALNTESKMAFVAAEVVLRGLQHQGNSEVGFRRYIQPHTTNRPAEQYLSTFYTYLCGPEPLTSIPHLPTGPAVSWTKVPSVCLDAADLINERAGRMWPGQKERFNSLLIAAFPPVLPTSLQPHVTVEAGTQYAFLFLGSDGGIRFRQSTTGRTKFAELTAQHGDVIGIKAGQTPMEVVLKTDGFGFVGIARQVYRLTDDPPPKESDVTEFPALAAPPPQSRPRASASRPTKSAAPKLPMASIEGWYIGPRPLDPAAPLRVRGVLEKRRNVVILPSSSGEQDQSEQAQRAAEETRWKGVVILWEDLPPLESLAPPPSSPLGKRKGLPSDGTEAVKKPRKPRKRPNEETPDTPGAGSEVGTPTVGKGRKKAKKDEVKIEDVEEGSSVGDIVMVEQRDFVGSSPAPRAGGKKAGGGGRAKGGGVRGKGKSSLGGEAMVVEPSPITG